MKIHKSLVTSEVKYSLQIIPIYINYDLYAFLKKFHIKVCILVVVK